MFFVLMYHFDLLHVYSMWLITVHDIDSYSYTNRSSYSQRDLGQTVWTNSFSNLQLLGYEILRPQFLCCLFNLPPGRKFPTSICSGALDLDNSWRMVSLITTRDSVLETIIYILNMYEYVYIYIEYIVYICVRICTCTHIHKCYKL